jgi:hypothetical protein
MCHDARDPEERPSATVPPGLLHYESKPSLARGSRFGKYIQLLAGANVTFLAIRALEFVAVRVHRPMPSWIGAKVVLPGYLVTFGALVSMLVVSRFRQRSLVAPWVYACVIAGVTAILVFGCMFLRFMYPA